MYQTFPEPLIFNRESGGFEVHSDARKQLANEIKAAVRASRRPKRIYRPTRHHSYSDIPTIPLVHEQQEQKEIDTSFTVKVSGFNRLYSCRCCTSWYFPYSR